MHRMDLGPFEALMQEMAEVYDRKPYGAAAIKHWFEALSEFHWEKVRYKLMLWRDSKPKAPMISELVSSLRDTASDERERRAAADKAAFARASTPVTEYGRERMEFIRRTFANGRRPTRQWAFDLMKRHDAGEKLYPLQYDMAAKAAGRFAKVDRVPGEDDA